MDVTLSREVDAIMDPAVWRGDWEWAPSSTRVVGEELEEGLVYTVSLRKVMVHQGPGQGWRWFQRKIEGALTRGESRTMRTVKAGRWEDLEEHLVPALQEGDLGYVCTFLGTYRVFASTEQVLDRLFHRYGGDLGGRGEPRGRLDMKTGRVPGGSVEGKASV
ncbi:ral guanine nucleotide dissociation stimulator-like [Dasypus novemcinctus]|uniref:ral guanine nucleotide dissociation stimulator-like n=1 Tax=Dasypus novemcinctus TaxID=9361 RepID=UPI00265E6806|nr:ral guanine nucleotide dissociation stimulator-like [Dasypus novemcinctus]